MVQDKTFDAIQAFEMATTQSKKENYLLWLYVAGVTPRSMRAITNIKKICEEHLLDRYILELIDLARQPERARADQIVAVPTLIKQLPLPLRRIIGELSGTGLCLPIARGLAHLHGGTILAINRQDAPGTEVMLVLPCVGNEAE